MNNEDLKKEFVARGLIGQLSYYLVGKDLDEQGVQLTVRSVMALVGTFGSMEARSEVIENNLLIIILSLYDSKESQLHGLWFDAMSQISIIPEFRSQIEQSQASIMYIKKALRLCEMIYAELMIAILNNLFNSAMLL